MGFEQVARAFLTKHGSAYDIHTYPPPKDAPKEYTEYVARVVQKMRNHYNKQREKYSALKKATAGDPSGSGPSVQALKTRPERVPSRRCEVSDSELEEEEEDSEEEEYGEANVPSEECNEEEGEEYSKDEGTTTERRSDTTNTRKRRERNGLQAGLGGGYRHRRR